MALQSKPNTCNLILGVGLMLICLICLPGCTAPKWFYGEGLTGPNADLGKGFRGSVDNAPYGTGVDQRAREIERNLGYRH